MSNHWSIITVNTAVCQQPSVFYPLLMWVQLLSSLEHHPVSIRNTESAGFTNNIIMGSLNDFPLKHWLLLASTNVFCYRIFIYLCCNTFYILDFMKTNIYLFLLGRPTLREKIVVFICQCNWSLTLKKKYYSPETKIV